MKQLRRAHGLLKKEGQDRTETNQELPKIPLPPETAPAGMNFPGIPYVFSRPMAIFSVRLGCFSVSLHPIPSPPEGAPDYDDMGRWKAESMQAAGRGNRRAIRTPRLYARFYECIRKEKAGQEIPAGWFFQDAMEHGAGAEAPTP